MNDDARMDAILRFHASLPWTTRALHWLALRIITWRWYLRDTVARIFGRPRYVRCANYCKVFAPCHRPATRSLEVGGFPILCAACDDAEPCGVRRHDVGLWHRAPYWVSYADAFKVIRPVSEKALDP